MFRWPFRKGQGTKTKVKYHIVSSGETISTISRKFKVTPDQLRFWNKMRDSQDMWIGQRIIVQLVDEKGNLLKDTQVANEHNAQPEEKNSLMKVAKFGA